MTDVLERTGHSITTESVLRWLLLAAGALYVSLFLYNSLTRTRQFTNDSMNYVDVARNVASGRGLVQSTLGFNKPSVLREDDRIPTPFVSQGPLYPVLIALMERAGLPAADAALMIPAAAYGVIFLLAYLLLRDLYGARTALLATSLLFLHAGLAFVSRSAWSESIGIVFLLASLWLLVRACTAAGLSGTRVYSFSAGAAAGLAFDTRYALLLLFFLGAAFLLIEGRGKRWGRQALLLYMLGATPTILPVLVHNVSSTGRMLPSALPSDRRLHANVRDVGRVLVGNFLLEGNEKRQAMAVCTLFGMSAIALAVKRRIRELLRVFVLDRHYLLTAWVLAYSSFIVYQRTVWHFDAIDVRIMAPGGVVLLMLGAALALKVIEPLKPNRNVLCAIAIVIAVVACVKEARTTRRQPAVTFARQAAQAVAASERLSWIAEHTTAKDLVIGDDTVDIPFYLGRRPVISFSRYPYTSHLTRDALRSYVRHCCGRYDLVYLVLRKRPDGEEQTDRYYFGEFITTLSRGDAADYPEIRRVERLRDAYVFEVSCN